MRTITMQANKPRKLKSRVRNLYHAARRAGYPAASALDMARTIAKFRALEDIGAVRIRAEHDEETSFDEGEEAFGTIGEFRTDFEYLSDWLPSDTEEDHVTDWEHADSCWGHVGYQDVTDPLENPYVVDEMAECVEQFRDSWKAYLAEKQATQAEERERNLGICPACHGTGKYPAGSAGARRDDPITRTN